MAQNAIIKLAVYSRLNGAPGSPCHRFNLSWNKHRQARLAMDQTMLTLVLTITRKWVEKTRVP